MMNANPSFARTPDGPVYSILPELLLPEKGPPRPRQPPRPLPQGAALSLHHLRQDLRRPPEPPFLPPPQARRPDYYRPHPAVLRLPPPGYRRRLWPRRAHRGG